MSFLSIEIFHHGFYYNRFEGITLEGFLGMCGFLGVLLLINRILGKKEIKESVFKNQNLSNYSLSFEEETIYSNLDAKNIKAPMYIKVVAIIITFLIIVTPLSELIMADFF